MALNSQQKQKRNRLIALSFVSVLLLLVYGPLAQWFVAADRVLYDQLASNLPREPLEHAVIVSVDPSKHERQEVISLFGRHLIATESVAELVASTDTILLTPLLVAGRLLATGFASCGRSRRERAPGDEGEDSKPAPRFHARKSISPRCCPVCGTGLSRPSGTSCSESKVTWYATRQWSLPFASVASTSCSSRGSWCSRSRRW